MRWETTYHPLLCAVLPPSSIEERLNRSGKYRLVSMLELKFHKYNPAFLEWLWHYFLGTVWMLEILSLIRSNGDPTWCQTVPNWDRAPWFETSIGYRIALANKSPRIISSHLPAHLFAKSFFKSKAKVREVINKIHLF